ncbi:MAG: hypothetical protein V7L01_02180 [Nostoc sp.]
MVSELEYVMDIGNMRKSNLGERTSNLEETTLPVPCKLLGLLTDRDRLN